MAKMRDQFENYRAVRRRSWRTSEIAVLVLLGFLLLPLLIEGVAVCVAQWAEVVGARFVYKTPLLTWSGSKLEDCRQSIAECMSYHIQDMSWEPGFVLPIMGVLIVIAMLLLRR